MTTERKKGTGKVKEYFRILSIDGGGIRGIIPGAVLMNVEAELRDHRGDPTLKIGDCFDMIAGTSTGGILTCIFLAPDKGDPLRARFTAEEALNLYMVYGDDIFDRSVWQKISSAGGVSDEKYSAEMLELVLRNYLQDMKLSELLRPCLITAYDTKRSKPMFFTQHDARQTTIKEYYLRDVARATSAAPTYFEVALTENLDSIPNALPMIDGGVFANNPAACALVEALKLAGSPRLSQMVVLSLGTGRKPRSISYKECKDWGLAEWAKPLIGILMEGVSQTVHHQLETIFKSIKADKQYLRIDGEFGDYKNLLDIEGLDPDMDSASMNNMKKLRRFGQQLAQNNSKEIKAFIKKYF